MWVGGAPGMRPNLIKFVYYQYFSEVPFWKSGPESGPRASNGSKSTLHITKRKWEPNIQHYSRPDNLWACFKVAEWGVFSHSSTLQKLRSLSMFGSGNTTVLDLIAHWA